jgi:quercetin dioxygenase-like cupin family protein/RimJ/RimL family protein N-acetyltransferase
VDISLRPVSSLDLPTIDRWASVMAGHLSRTRPFAEAADRHDPDAGLSWYVITEDGIDVGTVWIELLPSASEAVLGVFLGDASSFGRGIGAAAVGLAIAEFRRAHPYVPVVLRVRRSNERAIACYRRAGFTVAGSGCKSSSSGEAVPYYRMVCPPRWRSRGGATGRVWPQRVQSLQIRACDAEERGMTERKMVGKKTDVAALPMAGDGIEGVVKRVLVSPEDGWDGWVMRLFDIDAGGHTPKHAHDWPHVNFVASGHGALYLDGADHPLEAGSYAYVPAGREHQFCAAADEPLSFVCIVPAAGDY